MLYSNILSYDLIILLFKTSLYSYWPVQPLIRYIRYYSKFFRYMLILRIIVKE